MLDLKNFPDLTIEQIITEFQEIFILESIEFDNKQ
jgi:hypothetical protein